MYVSFKCSTFIDNPKGTLQLMIDDMSENFKHLATERGILSRGRSIRFSLPPAVLADPKKINKNDSIAN